MTGVEFGHSTGDTMIAKMLIAVVLSALLLTFHAPIHKQVIVTASVTKTTVAPKASTPKPTQSPQIQTAVATPPSTATFSSGCSTYDSLFRQYAWDVTVAEAICQAESGGNPYALSQTADRGLMQINAVHADMVNFDLSVLYNPTENIAVAYKLYSADGWSPWSTYLSGAYVRYL